MRKKSKSQRRNQFIELQETLAKGYKELRRWIRGSYFLVFLVTLIVVLVNLTEIVGLFFGILDVSSGWLPLFLTLSFFILFIVPIMSLVTRKKCYKCGAIVMRNAEYCTKCKTNLKERS